MENDYIPKNLEECFEWLNSNTPDIKQFLNMKEEKATAMAHHSVGRYIRNNWGLWEGKNELSFWFYSLDIKHPDDMSAIILDSFHRKMNNKDIKLNEQINFYINFWEGKDAFPKENNT